MDVVEKGTEKVIFDLVTFCKYKQAGVPIPFLDVCLVYL